MLDKSFVPLDERFVGLILGKKCDEEVFANENVSDVELGVSHAIGDELDAIAVKSLKRLLSVKVGF